MPCAVVFDHDACVCTNSFFSGIDVDVGASKDFLCFLCFFWFNDEDGFGCFGIITNLWALVADDVPPFSQLCEFSCSGGIICIPDLKEEVFDEETTWARWATACLKAVKRKNPPRPEVCAWQGLGVSAMACMREK